MELDTYLFNSSQHWTDTYVTGGLSPHICFGGFLPISLPDETPQYYRDYLRLQTSIRPFSTGPPSVMEMPELDEAARSSAVETASVLSRVDKQLVAAQEDDP